MAERDQLQRVRPSPEGRVQCRHVVEKTQFLLQWQRAAPLGDQMPGDVAKEEGRGDAPRRRDILGKAGYDVVDLGGKTRRQ